MSAGDTSSRADVAAFLREFHFIDFRPMVSIVILPKSHSVLIKDSWKIRGMKTAR